MIKLAITGGIGSGKTYVSSMLDEMGIPVYNADDNSKRIISVNYELQKMLKRAVGEDCFVDGKLNKRRLADFIFSSQENRVKVNSIIHPLVFEDFLRWAENHKDNDIVAMESAILYESGFDKYADKVIMVSAPEELRIQRVIVRDNSRREDVMSRISAQMDDARKCRLADYVVVNDGVKDVRLQLETIINDINAI